MFSSSPAEARQKPMGTQLGTRPSQRKRVNRPPHIAFVPITAARRTAGELLPFACRRRAKEAALLYSVVPAADGAGLLRPQVDGNILLVLELLLESGPLLLGVDSEDARDALTDSTDLRRTSHSEQ